MTELPFTAADLAALCEWDTPTICNALEMVAPARRGAGFSIRPFVCSDPSLKPICGLARTGTIRAAQPSGRSKDADRTARIGWYEYVGERPAGVPTVVVIDDLDETPGIGAFWGEVNSNVHKALGAAGVVTSGSIRDLDMAAPGFLMLAGCLAPSHAYVHVVEWALPVTVHGMAVESGAVVHADRHGAVVIPHDAVRALPAAIDLGARREKVILDLCKAPDFTAAKLRDALSRADEIH